MRLRKSLITKILEVIALILVIVLLMFIYNKILVEKDDKAQEKIIKEKTIKIFKNVEQYDATMDIYTMYGNHLNIGGSIHVLDEDKSKVSTVKITLKNIENEDIDYDTKYNIEGNELKFKLSENINEGINLDKIPTGNYIVLVKVNIISGEKVNSKYYTIKNETNYSNNEYYSITKESQNKRVDVNLLDLSLKDRDISYMSIVCVDSTLPDNVYDIVIDPGHGGKDSGAMFKDNKEAEYTLEYSKLLKEKLGEKGYKVKLTRIDDTYTTPYGTDGRAVMPNDVKAKLFLSIHLNSTSGEINYGGIEVYAPNHANLDLAKTFAYNIVTQAGTTYSPNQTSMVSDGVYVRTYTEAEIKEAIEYAKELEYEPYETLTTDTPYLFVIRETGGIMTHAYIDGRNKNVGTNPYYRSNMTTESYLLELGFINSTKDLENLKNNNDAYINAIVDAIVVHYK